MIQQLPHNRGGEGGGEDHSLGVFIKYTLSAKTVDYQNCGANLQEAGYQFKRISWVPGLYAKGDKYWYKFEYVKANIKNQCCMKLYQDNEKKKPL